MTYDIEPSNYELYKLLQRVQDYEYGLFDCIISFLCYKMNDSDELHEAVKLWLSDESKAKRKYDHIILWNTSNVTNMSYMFYSANMFY